MGSGNRHTSMRRIIIILVSAAAASMQAHGGEIFRCTSAGGDVMYTNISCPDKSKVEHIASYVAQPDTAPQPYRVPAEAETLSALAARESAELQQAQATGYRQAMFDYQQAQADLQRDAPYPDNALYLPVAAYPFGVAPFARSGSFRPPSMKRPQLHATGTPVVAHHTIAPNTMNWRHR